MIDLVASKQAEIAALCEEYGVRKLALFGSAASGYWHESTSDLDFLVDIGNYDDRVGKRFMGFLAGLDRLLATTSMLFPSRPSNRTIFARGCSEPR